MYIRAQVSLSSDGRLIQSLSPTFFQLSTLFTDDQNGRPGSKKGSSYYDSSRLVGTQPTNSYVTAAASYVSSWFGGTSAAKPFASMPLDDVLAGPNRPPGRIKRHQQSENSEAAAVPSTRAGSATTTNSPARSVRRPIPATPAGNVPGSTSTFGRSESSSSSITRQQQQPPLAHKSEEIEYNAFGMPVKKKRHELTDALNERGEKLDFLNENMERASQASLDFVNQAKRMAMMQGAKSVVQGSAKGALYGIGKMFD